ASGFWPDPIDLPNLDCINLPPGSCDWFILDINGTPLSCDPGINCPGGLSGLLGDEQSNLELAEKVALGQNFSTEYPDGTLWSARQGLYREIADNPQILGASAVIDSFFQGASNGEIGLLESVRQELRNLYNPSAALKGQWLSEKEARDFYLDSLALIDQLLEAATGPDSIWLFNQRPRLCDSLSVIGLRLSEVLDDIAEERTQAAQVLWSQNDAIESETTQGSNEKLINALFLSTLAQGIDTFSQAQIGQIESVAFQCIYDGGQAVTHARNLYRLVKDTAFEDKDLCTPKFKSSAFTSKEEYPLAPAVVPLFHLFPNPADDRLTIEFNSLKNQPHPSDFYLSIYSAIGLLEVSNQIVPKEGYFELDLGWFNPGMYWLTIRDGERTLFTSRFMVIR
ncbi:MAG: T9SS type A sorting domain-containing protein, partial [Saprospiraceae bacterium]